MSKKKKSDTAIVAAALEASEMLGKSPLASKLKAHGFTSAQMAKDAQELLKLRAHYDAMKASLAQAGDELAKKIDELAKKFASYANLVRALTEDVSLRAMHGVASPGIQKGPRFRRTPRVQPAPEPAPVQPNGASANGHA